MCRKKEYLKLMWFKEVTYTFRIKTFSSWVRRFANVPQCWWRSSCALCIRLMRFTLTWSQQSICRERSELLILRRFAHAKMCSELRRGRIEQQIQCRRTCCVLLAESFCAIKQRLVKCTTNHQLTPTWLEHATFWSAVRRATIAPRSRCTEVSFGYVFEQNNCKIIEKDDKVQKERIS